MKAILTLCGIFLTAVKNHIMKGKAPKALRGEE